MKEFDKWLKENDWQCWLYDEEDAAKEGWRAALGMVRNWYKESREGFDLGLWDMIEKELKNGDT